LKIAVIGCSKRFTSVYYEILRALRHDLFLWNRTEKKAEEFCKDKNISHFKSLKELTVIDPDLVLVFVPSHSQYDVVKNLPEIQSKILVETPIEDVRMMSLEKQIGVLEQWPYLPLEQFKRLIYSTGFLKKPYMVFNDGRSFDYHAMAQLRDYLGHPLPVTAKGSVRVYENTGVLDCYNKLNSSPHEWTIGQLEMNDGSIVSYSFSYNCKSLLSIPIQFLRCLSTDGSVITGRMKELGNDYEFVDVRCVDSSTKEVSVCEVVIDRRENTTFKISIPKSPIVWENPYAVLGFNDQQAAIATLIDNALLGNLYSLRDAYIDYICINMIKRSGYTQQTVNLT
jgi:hypothetical protein